MADKQIKDFAVTPLADTDSLIKQSIGGLTAKTTLADLKTNLDNRYQGKGTVVWEDGGGQGEITIALSDNWVYEFWLSTVSSGMPKLIIQRGSIHSNPYQPLFYYVYEDIEEETQEIGSVTVEPERVVSTTKIFKIISLGENYL